MDKSIETPFFKAFEFGEVVHNCIDYIRVKYDLGYMPRGNNKTELNEKWQNYYDVVLPKLILEATEAFDDGVLIYTESPLIDEIERNLNECQTDKQKERYIFSLLKPFSEISSIYCPTATVNRRKKNIQDCESDRKHWEALPPDKILFDTAGNQSGTPKEQIEACNSFIDRYKKDIDRAYYINSQFCKITGQQVNEIGSVEHCLEQFVRVQVMFANRLDALLLIYGIDLMRLQKESGIYLKQYRCITDVDFYIGSLELSQKYIDELPRLESGNSTNKNAINTNHSSMNYKQIVLNAYTEHREQKTSYQSYFKREAQIAKRDNFVEFSDYFDGCQNVLESYKNEIIRKYKKRLTEDDWVVSSVKSGSGINFDGEIVTDLMDERIQDSLRRIADDKEFVQNRGYMNNYDYPCYLNETGEITNDIWERSNDRKFFWQDIVQIEQGVNYAREELELNDSISTTSIPLQNNSRSVPSNNLSIDSQAISNKNDIDIDKFAANLETCISIARSWDIEFIKNNISADNQYSLFTYQINKHTEYFYSFKKALRVEFDNPINGKGFEIDIKNKFYPMIDFYNEWYSQHKEETSIFEPQNFYRWIFEWTKDTVNEIIKYFGDVTPFITDTKSENHKNELNSETFVEEKGIHSFNFNKSLISNIYEQCNNDIFICSESDFVKCIQTANFSLLKIKTKSKVKLLIYYMSKQMGSIWYKESAKSLGYNKSDCSGANVTDTKWIKLLKRIIPQ